MARLKRNSLLSTLQGTIGKEIVIKQYADKVVVSVVPGYEQGEVFCFTKTTTRQNN